jgi:hypothetical protein
VKTFFSIRREDNDTEEYLSIRGYIQYRKIDFYDPQATITQARLIC